MRKIGNWIMQDDIRFLAVVGVAILAVIFLVRPLFWSTVTAVEGGLYERPESVSQDVEDRALGYASLLVDEVEVRFDGQRVCPDEADACVRDIDPTVIHINQSLGEDALRHPASFAEIVLHEAAHVYDYAHDLDLSAFREFSATVPEHEVFADCAAQALVWVSDGVYLDCPEEGQRLALDILGIESASMTWQGDRVDVSVQWR